MKCEEFILHELQRERREKALAEASESGKAPAADDMKEPTKFMISGEAPVLMGKACELLVKDLSFRAWRHTERNRRRTLQRQDLHAAVGESEVYDFLIDVVPRVAPTKPQHPVHSDQNHLSHSQNMNAASMAVAATAAAAGLPGHFVAQQMQAIDQQHQQLRHHHQASHFFQQPLGETSHVSLQRPSSQTPAGSPVTFPGLAQPSTLMQQQQGVHPQQIPFLQVNTQYPSSTPQQHREQHQGDFFAHESQAGQSGQVTMSRQQDGPPSSEAYHHPSRTTDIMAGEPSPASIDHWTSSQNDDGTNDLVQKTSESES